MGYLLAKKDLNYGYLHAELHIIRTLGCHPSPLQMFSRIGSSGDCTIYFLASEDVYPEFLHAEISLMQTLKTSQSSMESTQMVGRPSVF
jgi:hypothetical protein